MSIIIFFGMLMLVAAMVVAVGICLVLDASTISDSNIGWGMVLCGLFMTVAFGVTHYLALIYFVAANAAAG